MIDWDRKLLLFRIAGIYLHSKHSCEMVDKIHGKLLAQWLYSTMLENPRQLQVPLY